MTEVTQVTINASRYEYVQLFKHVPLLALTLQQITWYLLAPLMLRYYTNLLDLSSAIKQSDEITPETLVILLLYVYGPI